MQTNMLFPFFCSNCGFLLVHTSGVHDKKYRNDDSLRDAAVTKTTKKQQASENYRKQQASASEPSLPSLVKSIVAPPTRKKNKVKKMKSKTINQFDDGSVGSNQSGSKTK